MKKITSYLCLSLLIVSCATPIKYADYKRRIYDDVPLNTLVKSEIGDKLITKGEEDYQDALRINEISSFSISTVQFPYVKGDILPLSGQSYEWFLYFDREKKQTNYDHIGLAKNKKTNEIKPFISSLAGFATKKIDLLKTSDDTFVNNNCNNCFKQEFIFNGKVGNSLKFIYREYINDMARPAFNQDLQYDINESNIVGFKGLRIEVINATNTLIEYKILSSFNK